MDQSGAVRRSERQGCNRSTWSIAGESLEFLALELLENPPAANAKLRAAAMAMPSPERTY
jgi:hypothetical protein